MTKDRKISEKVFEAFGARAVAPVPWFTAMGKAAYVTGRVTEIVCTEFTPNLYIDLQRSVYQWRIQQIYALYVTREVYLGILRSATWWTGEWAGSARRVPRVEKVVDEETGEESSVEMPASKTDPAGYTGIEIFGAPVVLCSGYGGRAYVVTKEWGLSAIAIVYDKEGLDS